MDIKQELHRANTCFQARDYNTARRIVQAVLEAAPENVKALNLLGTIHATCGEPVKGLEVLNRAMALAPEDTEQTIQLHFNVAKIHQMIGDFPRAMESFTKVVEADPDHIVAWSQLSHLHQIYDDHPESLKACHHVLRLAPAKDSYPLLRYRALVAVGSAETANRNFHAATTALTTAIAEQPDRGNAYACLANVHRDQGNTDEAVKNYLQAARHQPDSSGQIVNAATALLRAGNHGEAGRVLEDCLERFPGDRAALSVYGALLWETERDEEYRRLCDFDAFVSAVTIETPPDGYASMAAFNAALVHETRSQPALSYGTAAKATRGGVQTENLLFDPPPATRHLKQLINEKILAYMDDPAHAPHPLWSAWERTWDLVGWGVILASQGYQSPHNHPQSMVSGVYYLQVPEEVHEDGDGPGCIEFGAPYETYGTQRPSLIRRCRAVAGRMYLFPSQFLHRTVPFESQTDRICIAFDSIPRPSGA